MPQPHTDIELSTLAVEAIDEIEGETKTVMVHLIEGTEWSSVHAFQACKGCPKWAAHSNQIAQALHNDIRAQALQITDLMHAES